jgi:hypothetical protein
MKISNKPDTHTKTSRGVIEKRVSKNTNALMGFASWHERKKHYYNGTRVIKEPGPQCNLYVCYTPDGRSFLLKMNIREWLRITFGERLRCTDAQDWVINNLSVDYRGNLSIGPIAGYRLVRLPRRNRQGWYIPGYGNFDAKAAKEQSRRRTHK